MRANLILELTKRDFTERYAGSFLGAFWNFIMPAVMIFIYTVIFSRVMKAKMPGVNSTYSFGIYLIAGMLPWTAFSNTILRSASVFLDKKSLIGKMPVSLVRWALRWVALIINLPSFPAVFASSVKILLKTPIRLQRKKRLYSVLYGPYSRGASFHCRPYLMT